MPFVPETSSAGAGVPCYETDSPGPAPANVDARLLYLFIPEAASQINRLLRYPTENAGHVERKEQHLRSSRDLSRTIMLDTSHPAV